MAGRGGSHARRYTLKNVFHIPEDLVLSSPSAELGQIDSPLTEEADLDAELVELQGSIRQVTSCAMSSRCPCGWEHLQSRCEFQLYRSWSALCGTRRSLAKQRQEWASRCSVAGPLPNNNCFCRCRPSTHARSHVQTSNELSKDGRP